MMGVAVAAAVVVPTARTQPPVPYSANRRRLHSSTTSPPTSSCCFVLDNRALCSRLHSTPVTAVPEPPQAGDGITEQDRYDGDDEEPEDMLSVSDAGAAGFEVEIEKVGGKKRNRRRIRSQVVVDAALETVWSVLTDYEGLAGFIPNLAVSRLLVKRDNFARLYQVGQQDLALGLKFDAKGVLDCYERDLEELPTGVRRRNIDFAMVEGDFSTFEGRWSIEQETFGVCCISLVASNALRRGEGSVMNHDDSSSELLSGKRFQTTLIYVVEMEPKLWLPVGLIEGRLCKEVGNNLLSVRDEAQRVQRLKNGMLA